MQVGKYVYTYVCMHEFVKTLELMHYMMNTNVCIYANNARGYKTIRYTHDVYVHRWDVMHM